MSFAHQAVLIVIQGGTPILHLLNVTASNTQQSMCYPLLISTVLAVILAHRLYVGVILEEDWNGGSGSCATFPVASPLIPAGGTAHVADRRSASYLARCALLCAQPFGQVQLIFDTAW